MPKKQYRQEESIDEQGGETVCAEFAFCCHFLSQTGTSCPFDGGLNRLKTRERRRDRRAPRSNS
jgi:hypothetical protein